MKKKGSRGIFAWELADKVRLGADAPLIVCADEAPAKSDSLAIDGSISLQEFESRRSAIPSDREIIFFGSSIDGGSAMQQAAQYQDKGYSRISVLRGGIEAWNAIAGFR